MLSERHVPCEPIKYVPKDKVMAMGIVRTKVRNLETEDGLLRRMDKAASYLDPSQLAISPQCGFASAREGDEVDEEVQWRKLELGAQVADRTWGSR